MLNNQLNLVPPKEIGHELTDLEALFCDLDSSLSELAGKKVIFRSDYSKEVIPLQNLESWSGLSLPYQLQFFSQEPRNRQIIAVDSSCVLIGETDDGSIFAGRVAVVSAENGKIKTYYRAGPFIFYMSLNSVSEELMDSLSQKALRAIISDNSLAERYIRLKLERSAQILFARTSSDSIILIDGSLRSSILESRNLSMRDLERISENNFNHLLGISKASCLRFVSNAAGVLQQVCKSTVGFFDITEPLKAFIPAIESRVLVARFSLNAPAFRVDASRSNVEPDSQVLADLKQNNVFFRGYPETLRLAHHLSVFDSSTVASIRSYLFRKYGMVHIPSDDLRATVLGKFM